MSNVKFLSDTYQASFTGSEESKARQIQAFHPKHHTLPEHRKLSSTKSILPNPRKRPQSDPICRTYVQDLHLARTFKTKTKTKTKTKPRTPLEVNSNHT